jgi:type II secretory ATPase GspE/PulE/Tfp pilus assembly ATPase PilB-like protein
VSGNDAIDFVELEGETELMPPEVYAANLIEWATDRRASDLFVSDTENSVIVAVRRLGRVEIIRRLARAYGRKLQGHLRVISGSDAGEIVRPTEGRGVVATPSGKYVDLRLSSMPTLFGQDVAVRLFDPITGARPINRLGFDEVELGCLQDLISRPSGLILVAGPVASGKSSTLYAVVDALNDGSRKIHTLEDPIEHSIPGVMQSQVNLRAGLDFAELLSTVLRHSPDVIMIGEIRDARTAATAVRAGASGQLVMATIHAKSAAEAIDSLTQYETNSKFVARSLIGVINQRLLRAICPQCRLNVNVGPLEVPERVRQRLGDQPPAIYRAIGCEQCYGEGYSALMCVPEILVSSPEIEYAIADGISATRLDALAREQGMLSVAEAVAVRVLRGDTSPDEGQRCVPDPLIASLASACRNAGNS